MEEVIKNVQHWLSDSYSEETKKKIRFWAETKNFDLLNDAFSKTLEWSHGGIRAKEGIGSNRINHYTVGSIAQAFTIYLQKQRINKEQISVAIAYDNRYKSNHFAQIMAEVLVSNDIKVHFFDILTPFPVLAHGVRYLGCEGGIMITGGHYPGAYNGVKFVDTDGFILSDAEGQKFIEILTTLKKRADIIHKKGYGYVNFVSEEVDEDYIKTLTNNSFIASGNKQLKVCYTPWFGSGTIIAPTLFGKAGFRNSIAVEDHFSPSPTFDGNEADPTKVGTLEKVFKQADEEGADLIIATNSDCARVAVAARTKEGNFRQLSGQQMASIVVDFLLKKRIAGPERLNRKQFIATTKTTTALVSERAKAKNFKCKALKIGLSDQPLGERKIFLGLEESSGLLMPEVSSVKDGLLYGLILMELANEAKENDKTLWDLLYEQYLIDGVYMEEMEEVHFTGPEGEKLVDKTIHHFLSNPPSQISDLVRVRKIINHANGSIINPLSGEVDFFETLSEMLLEFHLTDNSRVYIRPSMVTPSIKYYATCHQLVELPQDLMSIETELKKKAKRLLTFFKNY